MEVLGKALESMVAVVDPNAEAKVAAEHVPSSAREPGSILSAAELATVRRSESNERTDLEMVRAAQGLCHGRGNRECEEAADHEWESHSVHHAGSSRRCPGAA